ncbi:MAG TPA: glycoside hydrolase family 9 protein [Trebonia sp.]|jgi:endoglucanase|nr:glycoside hydrolase family 9 protein [Trebonia sp.]
MGKEMIRHGRGLAGVAGAVAITAAIATPAAATASTSATTASQQASAAATPELRVDQVGYGNGTAKVAYYMTARKLPGGVPFTVIGDTVTGKHGVVYRGVSTDDVGSWSSRYGAVYELSFSGLRRTGTYAVKVGPTTSPSFRIASGQALYSPLVGNGVRYFTSERDGTDVEHQVLDREPANLTDSRADVYATPKYDDNDNLLANLTKIGGPVNVSGGWFDAGGGYEKFGYTASYADAILLMGARDFRGPYSSAMRSEAEFGLNWMRKLWNPKQKVMYIQVGIGNGNASGSIGGDYNYWFLPQDEDKLGATPGNLTDYYVEYRPVFEAAPPGQQVSPELAGRYAADYALGAQLSGSRASGRQLLSLARSVYSMAKTTDVKAIVTAYPNDYYPGTEWKSAMLWGASEIALADERLGEPRPVVDHDLAVAAKWAKAYIAQGHAAGGDTLNLYDNGALGEAELLRAMGCATRPAGRGGHDAGAPRCAPRLTVISPSALVSDMAAQLKVGEQWAKGDPFALGTGLGSSDASPHAFGLYVTNALYQSYGGSGAYASFAQQQLNYALGANPWGASFVVGAGSNFPHCTQSEIANLSGSLTGSGNIQLGATVDGPSSPGNFQGLGTVTGMRACSYGSYSPFDNSAAGYEDNVTSWPSVEPADDYTAISTLAFAFGTDARD